MECVQNYPLLPLPEPISIARLRALEFAIKYASCHPSVDVVDTAELFHAFLLGESEPQGQAHEPVDGGKLGNEPLDLSAQNLGCSASEDAANAA